MYHGSCLAAWHCFTAGTAEPGLAFILRRKVGQHLRDHRVDALLLLLGRRLRLAGARSSRAPQQRLALRIHEVEDQRSFLLFDGLAFPAAHGHASRPADGDADRYANTRGAAVRALAGEL